MVKKNKKKNTLKETVNKNNLKKKSSYYKSKIGGEFFKKSFEDKYLSSDNGLISVFFSETTSIIKKIEISRKINDKLIRLLINYSTSLSQKYSKDINILVNQISLENLKHFVLKKIDTNFFVNTDFLNIDLTAIFNNSQIVDYARNYLINLYYDIVIKYVGSNNKFFKIHEKYDILLRKDNHFFREIILFIKNNNGLYSCNINYIIIILYTYTTLKYDVTQYFPDNYYEIIIKSFLNYIKIYSYPEMNKFNYYEKLKLIGNIEINKLNIFNNNLKLTDIILHPSFTGKDIILKTKKKYDKSSSRNQKSTRSNTQSSNKSYVPEMTSSNVFGSNTSTSNKSYVPEMTSSNVFGSNTSTSNKSYVPEMPSSNVFGSNTSISNKSYVPEMPSSNVFGSNTFSESSNLFSSKTNVIKCPSNIKRFIELLHSFNDNKEYGYRWKILTCEQTHKKYGCNNLNYDLNDLKNNNYGIYKCEGQECEYQYVDNIIKIKKDIYDAYINLISNDTYPIDQIKSFRNTIHPDYSNIFNYISRIKYKNPLNDVIIINDNKVYIAYNRLKPYKLITNNTQNNYYIMLNGTDKIILDKLKNKSDSAYGEIFEGTISNHKYAIKLSLCDDETDLNFIHLNNSNSKEIQMFDIVTKYAISNININLPIIYKTIYLNADKELILKLFYKKLNNDKAYNKLKSACQSGRPEAPLVNCSIIELYTGNINYYIKDNYKKYKDDKIDYFQYLISGFENIIISILSFWSVTKCVHNDAHMGNFLYKLTNSNKEFNKYNIHGKNFYTSNYTKCNWTLWDYGFCMPFIYENYFVKKDINIMYNYDDIHKSIFLYCTSLLEISKIENYIFNLNNIFGFNDVIPSIFYNKTIEFIYIDIINELIKNNGSPYYNNSLFFDTLLYYIYNLRYLEIDIEYKNNLVNINTQINKNKNYNIKIDFIFKKFKVRKDFKFIRNFVKKNIYPYGINKLKKYLYNETLTSLVCCKFMNIYFHKKNNFEKNINKKFSSKNIENYNIANNVVCMVIDVITSFKKKKLLKDLKLNDLFCTKNKETTTLNLKEYYIGNDHIGKHWIKIEQNKKNYKFIVDLKSKVKTSEYNKLLEFFRNKYKRTSSIVVIEEITSLPNIFNFLNNFSSFEGFFSKSEPSYFYNYYIEYNNEYFVTYNDIDYRLYNKNNGLNCINDSN
jgi:hypothetical protein